MRKCMLGFFIFVTANSWAALPPVSPLENSTAKKEFGIDGIYKFRQDYEVIPQNVVLNGEVEDNVGGVSIDVHKDEHVAVEFLPGGEVLMTLQLADSEIGRMPEQLVLSPEEFQVLRVQLAAAGVHRAGRGWSDPSPRKKHKSRMESSRRGKGRFRRDRNGRIAGGGGNCVSVVKSITGFSGRAGNGVGMASALMSRGYRVISFSNRRRGTVCSWSGGWHGKGHVGWFDGRCFVPTYGGNCGQPGGKYRLLKCVARA